MLQRHKRLQSPMSIIQVLLEMENPCTWRHKFKPARIAIGAFDPRKRAQYMYNAHTVQQGATKDREPLTDHRLRQTAIDMHGWNYLQFTACTLHKEDEEDGHLALSHLARCEPLDDRQQQLSPLVAADLTDLSNTEQAVVLLRSQTSAIGYCRSSLR